MERGLLSAAVPMRIPPAAALGLCLLLADPCRAAGAETFVHPLGVSWGASVESLRERFPAGQLRRESPALTVYATSTRLEGIPVSADFQVLSGQGLQGVMLWFPLHRLQDMVAHFERLYGRPSFLGNLQWGWEQQEVRVSVGDYPSVRSVGRRGLAWLRTTALQAALARGEDVRGFAGSGPVPEETLPPGARRARYEEQLLRRINWQLRYPETHHGVYLVSLSFQLTRAGRASDLRIGVSPKNPDVAESVRRAVERAQPFPPPPGEEDAPRVSLTLTVTVFP
jgi:TonB family protein